jgi:hypothetical protein
VVGRRCYEVLTADGRSAVPRVPHRQQIHHGRSCAPGNRRVARATPVANLLASPPA